MFNEVFNKTFGAVVVERRNKIGMNQAQLAKKLGFSAQFLGRIEKGNAPMPESSFKKTVAILGLSKKSMKALAADSSEIYASKVLHEQ